MIVSIILIVIVVLLLAAWLDWHKNWEEYREIRKFFDDNS